MLKRGGRKDTGNSSMHQKEIGQETKKKTGQEAASVRTGKIKYRLFTPRHFIPLR